MNPLEGRNPGTWQFDGASLEAVVQSSQYQELNPLSAPHMQGSIAANDPPQLMQEQGGELTPDEIKKKRRNEQRKESRDRGKERIKKILERNEALERQLAFLQGKMKAMEEETASVKKENASLQQVVKELEITKAKTVTELQEREYEWKHKFYQQSERADHLQTQLLMLISGPNGFGEQLGAAPASDAYQASSAQAIASRQQHAAAHIQKNPPMVATTSTDPIEANSQPRTLPSSMQLHPANVEGVTFAKDHGSMFLNTDDD